MSADHDFGIVSLTVLIILFTYSVAGAFFEHKHFHIIHETGLGILLGIGAGGLFYWLIYDTIQGLTQFNGSFFFYILLPIIIFSGGYNLNKRRFFQNFLYIGLFGVLGTIVTFLAIFGLTYLINELDLITEYHSGAVLNFKLSDMMIFAATICASDSVAALTMIKPDKYPKLFSVVFGEGMVNDAVSIIIFISVEILASEGTFTIGGLQVLELIWLFFKEFVFSFIIGLAFGMATAWIFKAMRFLTESCILEIAIILYMGYASFAICELLELSGVIAVLVCGVVMAHYNFYNISQIGKISSQVTLQSLSLICESFIYVYLGISLWIVEDKGYFKYPDDRDHKVAISFSFFLYELVICFVSRGISIFFLTMVSQLFMGRKHFRLSFWELNIVWFAGLIRGSVAYALISKLKPKIDMLIDPEGYKEEVQIIEVMITTTLFMVISTTIILGALMPAYIVYNLKFQEKYSDKSQVGDGEPLQEALIRNTLMTGNIQGGKGENLKNEQKQKSLVSEWIRRMDERYIKPWFIYNYEERKKEIQAMKKYKSGKLDLDAINKRKTLSGPQHPGVRQQSMAIKEVLAQNKSVSADQDNTEFRRSKSQRVMLRSTLNTKFQGQQEIYLQLDVPLEEDDNEQNDSLYSQTGSMLEEIREEELSSKIRESQENNEQEEEK